MSLETRLEYKYMWQEIAECCHDMFKYLIYEKNKNAVNKK